MKRLMCCSMVALLAGAGGAFSQDAGGGSDLLEEPTVTELNEQEVDPNEVLLDILIRSTQKGPKFDFSHEQVRMDMLVGETRQVALTVSNTGDVTGSINSVGIAGSVPGFEISSQCEEPVEAAKDCMLFLSYTAENPGRIETVIIGTSDDRRDENFSIPVTITVSEPAPEPEPEPEPVPEPEPKPEPEPMPDPQESARATKRDIATQYFKSMPSPYQAFGGSSRGFTVVSAPNPMRDSEVAGTAYGDISVETKTMDEGFQDAVRTTQATLPVDLDKILTADRVIKAVLETPVSNVMCNKTVALVESDVYSATSTEPLIQAGSRLIGECQAFVDERVGIVWERIITVDGRSIVFENREADTNDAMGRGGAVGRVYSSAFDKYVMPIFSTMIDASAGVITAIFGEDEEVVTDANGNVYESNSATNDGIRIVTGETRERAQQVISDIQDVREISVVPAGSRIDVEINEDIVFDDERRVVAVADMEFDLEDLEQGNAKRDLPEELRLVPAPSSFKGATVEIGGRRYRLEEARSVEEIEAGAPTTEADLDPETRRVVDDVASAGQ